MDFPTFSGPGGAPFVAAAGVCTLIVLVLLADWRIDRKRRQRLLERAVQTPSNVSAAWIEGPDGDGYVRLRLQMGAESPVTLAGHFDSAAVAHQLAEAGIPVADRTVSY